MCKHTTMYAVYADVYGILNSYKGSQHTTTKTILQEIQQTSDYFSSEVHVG